MLKDQDIITSAFTNRAPSSSSSASSALFMKEENPYGGMLNLHHHHHHHDSNQLALSVDVQNYHYHHQDQSFSYPTPNLSNLLYGFPTSIHGSSTSSTSPPFVKSPSSSMISYENPTTHNNTIIINPQNQNPFLHLPHHHGYNIWPPPPDASTINDDNHFLVFGGEDNDREGSGVVTYLDADNGKGFINDNDSNGGIKLSHYLASVGKKGVRGKRGGKRIKQINTEKQRRVDFSSKFEALRELIPNPTKNDRASVVGDAIEYIHELLKSVKDLKVAVDKKRSEKERMMKRHKVDDEEEEEEKEIPGDMESCNYLKQNGEAEDDDDDDEQHNNDELEQPYINGCMIRRKSKDTEVDVRIMEDEVTIKLVKRNNKINNNNNNNINCLLYASKALHELHLDPQHVAGGHVGHFCTFLFITKIYEGSSVYASAIANKLIEVMDGGFQAA